MQKEKVAVNQVMKFSGGGTGLMNRDDLARSLNNVSTAAPRVGGEYQFLKMDKGNGDWVYGQEETVVEDEALWAVNPNSLEYGYIAWPPESASDREPEGEVMVPITRPLPDVANLRTKHPGGETTGAGWQYQQSVVIVCINGEDEGTICQYKQSSVGSQKLFKSLTDAVAGQLAKGSDAIVPIVRLKSDSYKHKKWGRIFNPIWEIVEWRTMDDTSPVDDEPEQAEEKPAEATRQPRKRAAPAEKGSHISGDPVDDLPDGGDKDDDLTRAYKQEELQAAAEQATPRRRVRR